MSDKYVRKQRNYQLIGSISLSELSIKVNEYLEKNWELYGDVIINVKSAYTYYQAVVYYTYTKIEDC